mmetsp:Transcript_18751/g.31358  ORF Transcript_18751/g.31358 Transcript_18751/m.31358 type:complete len:227 (+) Transcript_18751:102-782(+)
MNCGLPYPFFCALHHTSHTLLRGLSPLRCLLCLLARKCSSRLSFGFSLSNVSFQGGFVAHLDLSPGLFSSPACFELGLFHGIEHTRFYREHILPALQHAWQQHGRQPLVQLPARAPHQPHALLPYAITTYVDKAPEPRSGRSPTAEPAAAVCRQLLLIALAQQEGMATATNPHYLPQNLVLVAFAMMAALPRQQLPKVSLADDHAHGHHRALLHRYLPLLHQLPAR